MLVEPSVSIVINTNGRRASLARTLTSLRFLAYRNFEVCVVYGPSEDGTREMVASWPDPIRLAACDLHNLSVSRNIGIEMAAGDIVAFIDDDAIPEPEWLSDVVRAFDDPQVGGSGGIVLDNTGVSVQHQFVVVDRLGRADLSRKEPATGLDFPFTYQFPHLTGTNCAFRRKALLEIGGFDEEFEYFLDETDVCVRLHDHGWKIQHVKRGRLHHKFAPSRLRDQNRVTNPFPLLKNKIYFCLKHGRSYHTTAEILTECASFSSYLTAEINSHHESNRIDAARKNTYLEEIERAWAAGLAASVHPRAPRTLTPPHAEGFLPFAPPVQTTRKVFVFLSQSYAPEPATGVSRYVGEIARALAGRGHHVHVLTDSNGPDTVDFEDGVWVHRLDRERGGRSIATGGLEPSTIWRRAARYLDELIRIDGLRSVNVVEAPSWDAEALGAIKTGLFPVVVNVVTTMSHYLDSHPELRDSTTWMGSYGNPILDAEKEVFNNATALICASNAIREEIVRRYSPDPEIPIVMCPHGIKDPADQPRERPRRLISGAVNVLFVGRLEERKAPEILIEAGIRLLKAGNADLVFWLVGDGEQRRPNGEVASAYYESLIPDEYRERFQFFGSIPDNELYWLYANCDVLAAPSMFESFGLTAVEAMGFGKPVVASRIGGLGEIVQDGVTGLCVDPESNAIAQALAALVHDPDKRRMFGVMGRKRFEGVYSIQAATKLREDILSSISRKVTCWDAVEANGSGQRIALPIGLEAFKMLPGDELFLSMEPGRYSIVFWKHAWSGKVLIVTPDVLREENLYEATEQLSSMKIASKGTFQIKIRNADDKNEVIIHKIERQGLEYSL